MYLCVCLLVTFVSPAITAKLIEMPFGGLTHVGLRNHVLDEVPITEEKRAISWLFNLFKSIGS